ncbi:NAD-dependent epimerase/dehydratase family protein [Patescibacteria group bacterium]|nr:NAD-dependent epimerase/dehydratase family protein [Patescibacteria group bacterium]
MNIIVTGGAGFIASHVVDRLIDAGHHVAVIDNLSTGVKENLNPKASFYNLDIKDDLSEVFNKERPEAVLHFAAQINVRESIKDPVRDAKENILGSLNVFENCQKFNVKRVVFSSTGGAIYGDAKIIPTPEDYPASPLSPYGVAKMAVEKYLSLYPFESLILRFANVYGPRQIAKGEAGVVAIFSENIARQKEVVINGDGNQTRDFVFVSDVAEACLKGLFFSGLYNIGTQKETSVNELFELMKTKGAEYIFGEAQKEVQRSCLDISKAKKELGWSPKFSLDQGLKLTVDWLNEVE